MNAHSSLTFRSTVIQEARNLYQMFQTRELLHRMAYQHKTARAVEHMLTEALVLAAKTVLIPGEIR